MTYKEWLQEVQTIVYRAYGVDLDALPDWLSRDAYDDGLTPEQGADICLEESGIMAI